MKTQAWDEEENEEEPEIGIAEEVVEVAIVAKDIGRDSHEAAKKYIDSFFADKQMHCGGNIPKRLLHDRKRVSMVVNYTISKGVQRCYRAMKSLITEEEKLDCKTRGDSTRDIKLVNETLKLLAKSCVPQQFAGGMLVMYLEFVEGVSFK